jgi:hypothetical protein
MSGPVWVFQAKAVKNTPGQGIARFALVQSSVFQSSVHMTK